jgi:hypothetical protein
MKNAKKFEDVEADFIAIYNLPVHMPELTTDISKQKIGCSTFRKLTFWNKWYNMGVK